MTSANPVNLLPYTCRRLLTLCAPPALPYSFAPLDYFAVCPKGSKASLSHLFVYSNPHFVRFSSTFFIWNLCPRGGHFPPGNTYALHNHQDPHSSELTHCNRSGQLVIEPNGGCTQHSRWEWPDRLRYVTQNTKPSKVLYTTFTHIIKATTNNLEEHERGATY